MFDSLWPPWTVAHQASLSSTIPQSLLKFMSIESMMLSNHLKLCYPLLVLPSIFPSIRVFSNDLAFCIGWLKYWNFSISPSNEYSGLISLRIDWLLSLLSKGLSRVFSSITVRNHQVFGAQPSLLSNYPQTIAPFVPLPTWLWWSSFAGLQRIEICMNEISSSNQVKMSVCHIKDSGRSPFLVPYCCTHVWNYPQGKRFACKRALIGLRCDWLHRLHCQMNRFCKPNRRRHKLSSDYSGGIRLPWVTASGHREARALASASLLNNKIMGG